MNFFYFNKEKGVVISILGGMIISILFGIVLTLFIISQIFEVFGVILNNLKFILIGQEFTIYGFFLIILIFYFYEIIDSFIDGTGMALIKICFILFLFFLVLQVGVLPLSFSLDLLKISISFDLSIILLIIFIAYLWVLVWEVVIYYLRSKESKEPLKKKQKLKSKAKILKRRKKRGEDDWIYKKGEKIRLEPGEKLYTLDWRQVKYENKKSNLRFYVIDVGLILFFGLLYGLIRFFIFESPGQAENYNQFFIGFFFPIWALIFTSFKSIRHFMRSTVYLFITVEVQLFFREMGVITAEGMFILSLILYIFSYVFIIDASTYFNSLPIVELADFMLFFVGIIVLVQFVLLAVNIGFKKFTGKKSKVEMLLSNRYIYLRRKKQFNDWKFLFNLMDITIWPYNPSNYQTFYLKLKYKKESYEESWEWDYGRLSYEKTIDSVKRLQLNMPYFIIKVILLMVVGILTFQYIFGIFFIAYAFLEMIRTRSRLYTYNFKIDYNPQDTEGSLFIMDKDDILRLYEIPPKLASYIPKKLNENKNNSHISSNNNKNLKK